MSRSASNADATTTADDIEDNIDGSIGSNDAVEDEKGKFTFLLSSRQCSH